MCPTAYITSSLIFGPQFIFMTVEHISAIVTVELRGNQYFLYIINFIINEAL